MATVALLLNASFEPLKVVSAKRAVVLMLSLAARPKWSSRATPATGWPTIR